MQNRLAGRAGIDREFRGGIAGAMVGLGIVLPLGMLSFAALGPDGASIGVRAAFTSAIVGGFIAALVGGAAIPGSIPKTSTTLIFASYVAMLAADPALATPHGPDLPSILTLSTLCVVIAGALQLALGLAKLGSLIRYVPLPVLAGFMNGVAILIVVSQFRALLGLPGLQWNLDVVDTLRHVAVPSLTLGVATAAFAWIVARRRPGIPWSLAGFAFGTATYHLIRLLIPDADLGMMLGVPATGMSEATPFRMLASPGVAQALYVHAPRLFTTAIVLAIIGSMDALLAAVGMDTRLHTRHDANRLLVGIGLANIAVGAVGGLPTSFSSAVTLSVHRAGGRGLLSGIVMIATLLAIILFGRNLLGLIPVTVSAGIMVIVALGMFDQWSGSMLRQLRADQGNREAQWSLAVVLVVCVSTILFGFVVAIVVGVLLSVVLFVVAMNRSLVRSIGTGVTRSSRRIYFPDQAKLLREQGERIKIVELEGAVFFGTAEKLTLQVDQLANDARYIILDVKRVTTIDASGAMALERMARQLHAKRITLLLSGLVAGDRHARALLAFGTFVHREGRHWFSDADHALEHAERGLLQEFGVVSAEVELPFEALSLVEDLAADQRSTLQLKLSRVTLASGEVLFHKGDPGDRLFVLAKGSISVLANSNDAATAQRLASFAPGVIFGETAMLDGGGRTATGIADEPSVVYVLTRDALDEIRRTDPTLATQVLLNLARQLSARLRFASATIQAADY